MVISVDHNLMAGASFSSPSLSFSSVSPPHNSPLSMVVFKLYLFADHLCLGNLLDVLIWNRFLKIFMRVLSFQILVS